MNKTLEIVLPDPDLMPLLCRIGGGCTQTINVGEERSHDLLDVHPFPGVHFFLDCKLRSPFQLKVLSSVPLSAFQHPLTGKKYNIARIVAEISDRYAVPFAMCSPQDQKLLSDDDKHKSICIADLDDDSIRRSIRRLQEDQLRSYISEINDSVEAEPSNAYVRGYLIGAIAMTIPLGIVIAIIAAFNESIVMGFAIFGGSVVAIPFMAGFFMLLGIPSRLRSVNRARAWEELMQFAIGKQ